MKDLNEAAEKAKRLFSEQERRETGNWVSYTHIGVPDAPKELREKEIDVLYAKGNHCLGCLTTSGCYFIKGEQTNPKYQEHPNCHCKKGKYAPLAVTAICPLEKFTGYIFNEKYAYLGKKELFEEIFGYAIEDSEYLKTEYERQAREKYRSGDYNLKELKKYGQFISIQIELNTSKRGKATIVSGWNVKPNGNISCNTPYGG